jgi:response regulator RpfG family c-di-GMP phosphodiesterase
MNRVLCVDDDLNTLTVYRAMHRQLQQIGRQFLLDTEQDAQRALEIVAGKDAYAVILSDMQMPGMDGVQFLRWVKEIAPHTVRMMLTGAGTLQVVMDALHEGSIFRFLTKPCGLEAFDRAIAAGLEQYRLIMAEKELLEGTLTGSIDVLTEVLSLVKPIAFGRASRVRRLVKQIGTQLQEKNIWEFEIAAMLSQSGCITLPEEVLQKVCRGAELAPDERQMFAEHPRVGHALIAHIPRLESVALAIAYQEKHFDGTGTPPDGKKGADIPLVARVLKVALDFDVLETSGMTRANALQRLRQRSGWYDPALVRALEAVVQSDARETSVVLELTIQALTEKLQSMLDERRDLTRPGTEQCPGEMILAQDVSTTNDLLVLSKGHRLTLALLERLRNYSRKGFIREPIRVWVPERPSDSNPRTR